jgi:predicted membrane protein
MQASTVRTYAAAAAVPAALVVIVHLAYVWHNHPASAYRQSSAFTHGIAMAAILAAVLVAGRVALWLDRETRHVWAGVVGIVHTLVVHLTALVLIVVAVLVIGRLEDAHARHAPAR